MASSIQACMTVCKEAHTHTPNFRFFIIYVTDHFIVAVSFISYNPPVFWIFRDTMKAFFFFSSNRSQWSQRRVGTWPDGLQRSVTWSAPLRPRTACGRSLRWQLGRLCRPGVARKAVNVYCCKVANKYGQFYPGLLNPGIGLGRDGGIY